jgi:hypothetical protein
MQSGGSSERFARQMEAEKEKFVFAMQQENKKLLHDLAIRYHEPRSTDRLLAEGLAQQHAAGILRIARRGRCQTPELSFDDPAEA